MKIAHAIKIEARVVVLVTDDGTPCDEVSIPVQPLFAKDAQVQVGAILAAAQKHVAAELAKAEPTPAPAPEAEAPE